MSRIGSDTQVETLATLLIGCGAEEDDPEALRLVLGPWLDQVTGGRADDVLGLLAEMAERWRRIN